MGEEGAEEVEFGFSENGIEPEVHHVGVLGAGSVWVVVPGIDQVEHGPTRKDLVFHRGDLERLKLGVQMGHQTKRVNSDPEKCWIW